VPDITNNQVQINVRAPALSPELVEKQVSFPVETALAGIPSLDNTRSLTRSGSHSSSFPVSRSVAVMPTTWRATTVRTT
jgi:Cu/Ag efflux pump CusA